MLEGHCYVPGSVKLEFYCALNITKRVKNIFAFLKPLLGIGIDSYYYFLKNQTLISRELIYLSPGFEQQSLILWT
jgi:hypothetical protein